MEHPVVWFEINGSDAARQQAFYAKVFGWRVDPSSPVDYGLVEHKKEDGGIPGGLGPKVSGSGPPMPGVTVYVETSSIDRTLRAIEELGGSVLVPRTQLPGGPVIGLFTDLDGNAVGLIERAPA